MAVCTRTAPYSVSQPREGVGMRRGWGMADIMCVGFENVHTLTCHLP